MKLSLDHFTLSTFFPSFSPGHCLRVSETGFYIFSSCQNSSPRTPERIKQSVMSLCGNNFPGEITCSKPVFVFNSCLISDSRWKFFFFYPPVFLYLKNFLSFFCLLFKEPLTLRNADTYFSDLRRQPWVLIEMRRGRSVGVEKGMLFHRLKKFRELLPLCIDNTFLCFDNTIKSLFKAGPVH